jgi:hypothetical protein
MSEHPDPASFEHFIMGTLDDTERGQFERHAAACERCAAALAREARLELALVELAAMPAAPRRRAARALWAAPMLAAAAALLVWWRVERGAPFGPHPADALAPPSGPVVCSVVRERAACIAAAHRRGLYVSYPSNAGAPTPIVAGAAARRLVGGTAGPSDRVEAAVARTAADHPSSPPFADAALVDL